MIYYSNIPGGLGDVVYYSPEAKYEAYLSTPIGPDDTVNLTEIRKFLDAPINLVTKRFDGDNRIWGWYRVRDVLRGISWRRAVPK